MVLSALAVSSSRRLDEFDAPFSWVLWSERPRSNDGPLLALSIEGGHFTAREVFPIPDGSDFSLVVSRALGKVVVHVHGLLDSNAAPTLKEGLVDVIDGQGNRQVVLDLRKMTGVDSAGLSVLADALRRMDDYGGELLLSGPTSSVEERLRAAGLEETFGITPEWTHPARGGTRASRKWQHDGAR